MADSCAGVCRQIRWLLAKKNASNRPHGMSQGEGLTAADAAVKLYLDAGAAARARRDVCWPRCRRLARTGSTLAQPGGRPSALHRSHGVILAGGAFHARFRVRRLAE